MVTDILSINEDGLAFVEGAERRCLGFIPVTQPRAVSRDPSPKQFWMFAVGRYACVQSDIEKDIIFIIPLDATESTERRRIFRYADALPLSLNTSCVEHIITCVGWVRSHNSLCLRVCCLVKRLDESNARLYGFHVELEQKARAFSVGPPIAAAWTTPIPTHCQPSLVGAVLIPKVCSGGEDQIIVHTPTGQSMGSFVYWWGSMLPFQRFYLQGHPLDVLVESVTCVDTPPYTPCYEKRTLRECDFADYRNQRMNNLLSSWTLESRETPETPDQPVLRYVLDASNSHIGWWYLVQPSLVNTDMRLTKEGSDDWLECDLYGRTLQIPWTSHMGLSYGDIKECWVTFYSDATSPADASATPSLVTAEQPECVSRVALWTPVSPRSALMADSQKGGSTLTTQCVRRSICSSGTKDIGGNGVVCGTDRGWQVFVQDSARRRVIEVCHDSVASQDCVSQCDVAPLVAVASENMTWLLMTDGSVWTPQTRCGMLPDFEGGCVNWIDACGPSTLTLEIDHTRLVVALMDERGLAFIEAVLSYTSRMVLTQGKALADTVERLVLSSNKPLIVSLETYGIKGRESAAPKLSLVSRTTNQFEEDVIEVVALKQPAHWLLLTVTHEWVVCLWCVTHNSVTRRDCFKVTTLIPPHLVADDSGPSFLVFMESNEGLTCKTYVCDEWHNLETCHHPLSVKATPQGLMCLSNDGSSLVLEMVEKEELSHLKSCIVPGTQITALSFDKAGSVHMCGLYYSLSKGTYLRHTVLMTSAVPDLKMICALPVSSEGEEMSWEKPLAIDATVVKDTVLVALSTRVVANGEGSIGRCLIFKFLHSSKMPDFPSNLSRVLQYRRSMCAPHALSSSTVSQPCDSIYKLPMLSCTFNHLQQDDFVEPLCWYQSLVDKQCWVFVRDWRTHTPVWVCIQDIVAPNLSKSLQRYVGDLLFSPSNRSAVLDFLVAHQIPKLESYFYTLETEVHLEQASESLMWMGIGDTMRLAVSTGLFVSLFEYQNTQVVPIITCPQTTSGMRFLRDTVWNENGRLRFFVEGSDESLALAEFTEEPRLVCRSKAHVKQPRWRTCSQHIPLHNIDSKLKGTLLFQWTDKNELAVWCCSPKRLNPAFDMTLLSVFQAMEFKTLRCMPCVFWIRHQRLLAVSDISSGRALGYIVLYPLNSTTHLQHLIGAWVSIRSLTSQASYQHTATTVQDSVPDLSCLLDFHALLRLLEASLLLNVATHTETPEQPVCKQRRTGDLPGTESHFRRHPSLPQSRVTEAPHPEPSRPPEQHIIYTDSSDDSCASEAPLDISGLRLDEDDDDRVGFALGDSEAPDITQSSVSAARLTKRRSGRPALVAGLFTNPEIRPLLSVLTHTLGLLRVYRLFTCNSVAGVECVSDEMRSNFLKALSVLMSETGRDASGEKMTPSFTVQNETFSAKLGPPQEVRLPPFVDAVWVRKCTDIMLHFTLDTAKFIQTLSFRCSPLSPINTQTFDSTELVSRGPTLDMIDVSWLLRVIAQTPEQALEAVCEWLPYDTTHTWGLKFVKLECDRICQAVLRRLRLEDD